MDPLLKKVCVDTDVCLWFPRLIGPWLRILPSSPGALTSSPGVAETREALRTLILALPLLFQANEMLFCGRKLTAQEACSRGLVSQVFWPTTFSQEVMLRVKEMASCSALVSPVSPCWSVQETHFVDEGREAGRD